MLAFLQIRHISLNAPAVNEPTAKDLLTLQRGKLAFRESADVKTNASLYASIDGLRAAQRTWTAQTGKAAKLYKLIQLLLLEAPLAAYAGTSLFVTALSLFIPQTFNRYPTRNREVCLECEGSARRKLRQKPDAV